MNLRLLNDAVLIKVKKGPQELTTKSGIILRGVEHDFFVAEVVSKGPGKWHYDYAKDTEEFVTVDCEVGDVVIVEKNFYHEYHNRKDRQRVENTTLVEELEDENFKYYLTKDKDIYLKFESWTEADEFAVMGELYSIEPPRPVQRV